MISTDWQEGLELWPPAITRVPFDIGRSALVIVDMQRYWTDPSGPIGKMLATHYPHAFSYFYDRLGNTVIPAMERALVKFRELHLPVVHVTSGAMRSDGRDLAPHLQRRRASNSATAADFRLLQLGSKWMEATPELSPVQDEVIVVKTTRSAFTSTGIDQLLRHMGVEHVLVGGTASNGCVETTARDAADTGYETFLLEDGCATFTEDAHVPVFRTFHMVFGTVLSVSDAISDCE